ncbi:hypothetical protein L3Q82_016354 [Scortum barcoo]|uniref:Uncharacterized protein n=1 Tax=Scortum barcoo TaxID=214431 RepID=A0ACB8X766_9TELE|nr:hypothetical protein L3Q82_016354 [Scortum barcoo]
MQTQTPPLNEAQAVTGMMIRPKGDQLEISFSVSETESWDSFIKQPEQLSCPCTTTAIRFRPMITALQINTSFKRTVERSGIIPSVPVSLIGPMLEECSGISDRYYGYNRGQPCILIKLNRVCRPLTSDPREDSDKIGPLAYYPPNGTFNLMYYPYYGKKAQVTHTTHTITTGELHSAAGGCEVPERLSEHRTSTSSVKSRPTRSPAGNERDKFAGRVSFKLRINDK